MYSTDRFKAVVPVLSLTLCCFLVYYARRFVLFYLVWFLFLCFSILLALRSPRLRKRELILVPFVRLFDLRLFGFVCFLPLRLSVWERLRFVIVALPGLVFYLFVLRADNESKIMLKQCTLYLKRYVLLFVKRKFCWNRHTEANLSNIKT